MPACRRTRNAERTDGPGDGAGWAAAAGSPPSSMGHWKATQQASPGRGVVAVAAAVRLPVVGRGGNSGVSRAVVIAGQAAVVGGV